jgi:HPt (histidine-containing phosphotransfer) domain-containing protein
LTDFARDFGSAAIDIRRALVRGDAAGARRLAHGLKGVAGTLSATAIYGASRDLEMAIVADLRQEAEDFLASLEVELARVVGAVEQLSVASGERPTEGSDSREDWEELRPLLREFSAQLQVNDLAALRPFARLKAELRGVPCQGNLAKLEEYMVRLDFTAARSTLWELARDLDLALEE